MTTILSFGAQVRSIVDSLLCKRLYPSLKVEPADLHGKNVIVTGANVGIGLEIARKLASYGANVTLACRDTVKAETARQDIVKTTESSSIDVKLLDLSTFASVKAFVTDWGDKPVDILVNNAGMNCNKYVRTADGYEATYAVDFLSHVLLTLLLLPRFTQSARVVNVSSLAQYSGTRQHLNPKDLDGTKLLLESKGIKIGDLIDFDLSNKLYQIAKLSQVVFTLALQERLDASSIYGKKDIAVTSCHPGLVQSGILDRHLGSSAPEYEQAVNNLLFLVNGFGVSNEQGACTPVFLAVDPSVGRCKWPYWDRNTPRTPNPLVYDELLRKELWTAWMKECGIPDPL